MKKLFLLILLFSSLSFSQRESFFAGNVESGGFGAVSLKCTSIKNDFGLLVGGYGGWLIDHQLLLGAGGYGLTTNNRSEYDVKNIYSFLRDPKISFGYGGGVIEYYLFPFKRVHASVSVLIGGGRVAYTESGAGDYFEAEYGEGRHVSNTVFVFEPGASVEFNINEYAKLGIIGSYRLVNGVNMYGVSNSDFRNFSAGISLKFGRF